MSAAAPTAGTDRNELPLPVAFLASCLICTATAAAAYLWLSQHRAPPPPRPVPVRVVLVQLPTPIPPPPVAPPPDALPPPPPPVVLPVTPTGTVVVPAAPPAPSAPPRREPPRRVLLRRQPLPPRHQIVPRTEAVLDAPPAVTAAVKAPPAPRPAASDTAARDTLEGRIKQAIQRAFHYPESARMMGAHGTALVGFAYCDRSVSDIRILRSSTSSILDAEAIRDVRDAVLPPPGPMAGKTLSLEVAVVFDLVSDED